ncbi:hypothetical protein DH2020_015074 [Rehmannia glutinosa]|uniref:Uncharacterized protein n=1 Tax=Rehmannia glutinosa TaxID=99300 RepID=A0ABR0WZ41_REHGL
MKGIDIFCASQASTAICFSNNMEQNPSSTPSSSSSTLLLPAVGGAAIDRHNPIIRDPRRIPKYLPPNSHPPIAPKSQKIPHKKKNKRNTPFKENAKKSDDNNFSKLDDDEKVKDGNNGGIVRNRWKCTNPGDFISPPGSTRYLLRDKVVFDASSSDFGLAGKLSLEETSKSKDVKTEELFDAKPPHSSHSPDQVVVLSVITLQRM